MSLLVVGGATCSPSRPDVDDEPGRVERAAEETLAASAARDHRNAEYVLSGQSVRLVDGVSEVESAPGSAATVVTRYLGHEARRDLDGDGREDVAFLVAQESGGSGTFYHLVAALRRDDGYVGSHGVLLGDRIAPQSTEIRSDGVIVVTFAERASGESFATPPSVVRSLWLLLDPETLRFGEVAQDFEGEADPARMSLDMKIWSWIRTTYADGTSIEPRRPGAFTLTLADGDTFSVTTDCNPGAGSYDLSGSELRFGVIATTRMFCDGAQEGEFTTMLGAASSHRFTSRGELVLTLEPGGAMMVFR